MMEESIKYLSEVNVLTLKLFVIALVETGFLTLVNLIDITVPDAHPDVH
jgi:hypothetical protein